MTGAMVAKFICLPNREKIMMKLMWSLLENVMKNKVMKKYTNLPVQNLKFTVER